MIKHSNDNPSQWAFAIPLSNSGKGFSAQSSYQGIRSHEDELKWGDLA
jgi:hypothetical protein